MGHRVLVTMESDSMKAPKKKPENSVTEKSFSMIKFK